VEESLALLHKDSKPRIHHRFASKNGISLTDLKGALGVNAFEATKRNAARGNGNTDPNHAYLQQGAVTKRTHWRSVSLNSTLPRMLHSSAEHPEPGAERPF
jgi:hypothetical protein